MCTNVNRSVGISIYPRAFSTNRRIKIPPLNVCNGIYG